MLKTSHGNKTERIHALDSLRAIMMLLGVVIHSAITYGTVNYGNAWSLKDTETTSLLMDYIVFIIHSFRMPIFFVVAGFFGAMLFFERGSVNMLKNRFKRILFPLIVFVIVLSPTILFAFTYSRAVFAGTENPFVTSLTMFSNPMVFIPPISFHMWFLYYLLLITLVSFAFGLLFEKLPLFTNWSTKQFNRVIKRPLLKVLVFSVITILVLLIMKTTWVNTSTAWIPEWKTFVFYFFFYGIGWLLFKSKGELETFKQFDWLFTILAIVISTAKFFFSSSLSFEIIVVMGSVSVWLYIFGITGLFIRYGSQHSHLMRYNSDSSYWIYLIHLSIVAIIPGLIAKWQVSAIIKFLFVFTLASFICVITYHYFVRSTFIGKFLNGRKYSRNIHAKLKPERSTIS